MKGSRRRVKIKKSNDGDKKFQQTSIQMKNQWKKVLINL
jgi:hypothetical protein